MKVIRYLLLVLSTLSCTKKSTSFLLTTTTENSQINTIAIENKDYYTSCNDPLNYVPDSTYENYFERRVIRINFHFPDDQSRSNNFSDGKGNQYFRYLVENAVFRFDTPEKMHLPEGNQTPVFKAQLGYQITPSKGREADQGFYYEVDDTLSYFVNKGRGRNNYDTKIIKKYAIDDDTILNAFIMPHHPDSLKSKNYKTYGAGIALGSSIKIAGIYQLGGPEWGYATLLNHEVGHVFGLSHSWNTDGCDDTPKHPNCFYSSGVAPCDGVVSNNLMDYNNSQMAITPCQLGRIHRLISDTSSFQRKLIIPSWCKLNADQPIIITTDVKWMGGRDVSRNIIIKEGGHLHLCCRLSMPSGSSITVEPGGELSLERIVIHNDCGDAWDGIIVQSLGEKKGIVNKIGKVEIYNVKNYE